MDEAVTSRVASTASATAVTDWTAPGVFEVAPGVHRIPLPLPNDALRAVNVYALTGAGGLTVIDSGWALDLARERLESALATLGHALGDISQFLMTHVHRDHYTQAVLLRREFGTRVALGIGERPSLDLWADGAELRLAPQLRRLRRNGAAALAATIERDAARRGGDTPWELPDEWLIPGDITLAGRTLEAIPTPGHTRGHLCYRDADGGLLFAGDHVLPHITPSIGFEPAVAALPLADYLQSLRLVRERPDSALLPAHGLPAPSVHARIDELLAHHSTRLQECEGASVAGAATAFEVATRLVWTRRGRTLAELDVFNQMMAVLETAAHLDVLVMRGRLRAEVRDGTTGYVPR
ncbi:MAG TPA: MBL fold metallo-hydrolase [Streptosporangiaceae bacterium]|jgi:glyoxylase-like metal-dependent hydrolase (beta-lactamase superfamily II)